MMIPYTILWDVQYGDYLDISGFWQGQGVWSSDTYEQSSIELEYKKTERLQKSVKKPGQKSLQLPVNGGHYDGVASFELPYGKHRVEFEFL
jgi:hypothetical protein